ncbi:hypothetical protein HID58_086053 [Brassica napus]|uniref:Uncharacterized protein n=1 Tax=Brassica napus TaxID=3708 RepID=A0ABQ7XPD2_BRANA|nr:hypothetical protein HID58_086049 [Brassica napus]KAH0857792.1 hypothetical protein HID58_086053 [Brassica napus]
MNTSLHRSETSHCMLQLNFPKMYELEDNYGLSQPVATSLKIMDAISSAFSYMQMGSSGKVKRTFVWYWEINEENNEARLMIHCRGKRRFTRERKNCGR